MEGRQSQQAMKQERVLKCETRHGNLPNEGMLSLVGYGRVHCRCVVVQQLHIAEGKDTLSIGRVRGQRSSQSQELVGIEALSIAAGAVPTDGLLLVASDLSCFACRAPMARLGMWPSGWHGCRRALPG